MVDLTIFILDQIRWLVQDIDNDVLNDLDDSLSKQIVLTVEQGQQRADIFVQSLSRQFRKLLEEFGNVLHAHAFI